MRPGRRLKAFARALSKRTMVVVALAGYALAVTGYPLPARIVRDLRRPYPCQHHACGCVDADHCWQDCCCYTPEQKLAWARDNQVEPPASLLATLEHLAKGHSKPATSNAAKASSKNCQMAACGDREGRAPGGCCSAKKRTAEPRSAKRTGSSVEFVIGSLARQCRGQVDSWCSVGAVLPPPAVVAWQFDWTVAARLSESSPLLLSRDLAPPSPPPRV